jgi:hypothetical protein
LLARLEKGHDREDPAVTNDLDVGPLEQARKTFAQQDVVGDDNPTAVALACVDRLGTLRVQAPAQ